MTDAAPSLGHNRGPDLAERHMRPQIQDLRTENIADMAARAQQLGDVIPLWYGEGDIVTPAFVRDAAKAALDDGLTFYIPDMRGWRPLIETLSAYQTRIHGRTIGLDRSTVTPGGMQALLLAVQAICDLGQNIVYLEPQWPNIHNVIHMVGGEPRPVPMTYADGRWHLDFDRIAAACDARTRAIFLSTPSNPAGWVATTEDLRALLDFARARGIWIISDEVYARLHFSQDLAPSILSVAEPEDLVLAVNSFSKAWAMTGWRVGWLVHPPSLSARLTAMTQYMNSGTAGVLQAGAAAAITQGEDLVRQVRDRCRAGVDLTYRILGDVRAVDLPVRPEGGMYVFFRLTGEDDAKAACRRILETAKVGLAPGYLFGAVGKPFLRICVMRDAAVLTDALGRMRGALG